ncbi:MAG: hypothetical protein GDA39_04660 [Hyphomonadaceae bacterium]|nr:hypothetical protein [Hyphomonadaceae bacterium]MBC6412217.1 hypothetical protein [Hyphomonadaceae bacterium]
MPGSARIRTCLDFPEVGALNNFTTHQATVIAALFMNGWGMDICREAAGTEFNRDAFSEV